MQRVAERSVIAPESTTQGVALPARGGCDEVDGLVPLVEPGHHRAWIPRIALGHPMSKDKAGSGLGEQTDLAPELGWTIAFAFDDSLYVSPISHFIPQSTHKQVIIDRNPFQNRKPLGIGTVALPVASRCTDCASLISVAPQHFALTGRRSH